MREFLIAITNMQVINNVNTTVRRKQHKSKDFSKKKNLYSSDKSAARTLSVNLLCPTHLWDFDYFEELYHGDNKYKQYTYKHECGWTVSGQIKNKEDKYWVNEFRATHPVYGFVRGDFEKSVTFSTVKAYENFMENFKYEEWDYSEI